MTEQDVEVQAALSCVGSEERTVTSLDTSDTNATSPCSESPASAVMNKDITCAESSIQNSENDDSADSHENEEFLSMNSDLESDASKDIYIDIYEDVSLSEESMAVPDAASIPAEVPILLTIVNDKSPRMSSDSRQDNFFITAEAQREVLKSFSNPSICTLPTQTSSSDICRICHCESDPEIGPLIGPCFCRGSLRFVHQDCLQQWIKSSNSKECELCGYHFVMETKVKPIRKWKKLTMSPLERRKLLCTVLFHIIAITCVTWSLYVLIEKTAGEIEIGDLQWPFWTKLVVVGIGFIGGLVFMYIQCKVYAELWSRLRAYNRVIYIKSHSTMTSSSSIPEDLESGGVAPLPALGATGTTVP